MKNRVPLKRDSGIGIKANHGAPTSIRRSPVARPVVPGVPAIDEETQTCGGLLGRAGKGLECLANDLYIRGVGAFGALGDFEFNLVPLFQGFEPLPDNRRMVNEDILLSADFDESEALLIVKPLYASSGHQTPSI